MPDVYVYDEFQRDLKIQIVRIWRRMLGSINSKFEQQNYREVVNVLCDEYSALDELPGKSPKDRRQRRPYKEQLEVYFLLESDIEKSLSVVEVSFQKIATNREGSVAIHELNERFKEHGVGYHFEGSNVGSRFASGQICRIDSEFIHVEVVIPALRMLNGDQYAGAQEEFLNAHEHYRKGRYKEALNECLKAFESVMKVICDRRGWDYSNSAGAAGLIDICIDNELIPRFWESQYNSLRCLLRDSVPTGRNKLSSHGSGSTPTEVPEHVVAYMIHMTASAIMFLASADKNLS